MKLKSVKIFYTALLVIVLFIISRNIPFGDVLNLTRKISMVQLGLILLLLCVFTLVSISFWMRLISNCFGKRIGLLEAIGQHALMSWGKYLPSGVLGIVGRHHMLSKLGVSNNESISLLFNEQLLTVLSGVFIVAIALLIGYGADNVMYSALAALAFAATLAFPMIFDQLLKVSSILGLNNRQYLLRIEISPNYHVNLTYAVIGWLMQSALFIVLLEFLVGPELSVQQWILLAGLQCLSVLAGLLAVFAPAGIGIREVVLVAVGIVVLPKHDLLMVAVAHRLVLMFWDFVVGLSGLCLRLMFKDKERSGSF